MDNNPPGAFGLSLAIGSAVMASSIGIFIWLLHDVVEGQGIALFDAPIVNYAAIHRLGRMTEFMQAITYLGDDSVLAAVVIASGLFLRLQTNSWRPLILLSASAIGASLLHALLAPAIGRQRPAVHWIAVSATGSAFPSGHASESTAVYGALACLLFKLQTAWRAKLLCAAAGALIAVLVGLSRVYLGVHWPTDIISGWALGVAWIAIVFMTASLIEKAV